MPHRHADPCAGGALLSETVDGRHVRRGARVLPRWAIRGVCPMHGKRAVANATDPECAAQPIVDLHDIFMTLSSGGVVPTLVVARRSRGLGIHPAFIQPSRPSFARSSRPSPPRLTDLTRYRARSPWFGEESMKFLHVLWQTHGARRAPCVRFVLLLALFGRPPLRRGTGNRQLRQRQRRVTDPQGAVVPGARVTARQTETNIARDAVTDTEGRFRFPYSEGRPLRSAVRHAGFADATRPLDLTVGAAFELPIALDWRPSTPASRSAARPRCSKRRGARSPARSRRRKLPACR